MDRIHFNPVADISDLEGSELLRIFGSNLDPVNGPTNTFHFHRNLVGEISSITLWYLIKQLFLIIRAKNVKYEKKNEFYKEQLSCDYEVNFFIINK